MQEFKDVLTFWFVELSPKQWWEKDPEMDEEIRHRFGDLHHRAAQSELFHWREFPKGRLAEIIILDQFSRNIYRDGHLSFAQDHMALSLAQEAIRLKIDEQLSITEKSFLYLPFMHSESLVIHEEAVKLFSQKGLEYNLDFEYKHKVIIEKFGRYPHRNKALKRESTPDEIAFLKTEGSSF